MSRSPRSTNAIPLPPLNAEVKTMSCQYCIVGCGYKSYVWPTTEASGTQEADGNALGVDFPRPPLTGNWPAPGMHNVIRKNDGRDYNVLIMPDTDCVVNRGNHSSPGGSNARAIWSPYGPTHDRLSQPLVKVGGAQQPIPWDAAIEILAAVIGHTNDTHGPESLAIRLYAYQYYENTFPITKFYFGSIGTPNGAIHNRASMGGETTALGDAGITTWGTAYEDGSIAETVVAWGANLYECQDIYFAEHIVPSGAPLVTIDPRKTFTAVYGESVGGVHLQLVPGTDTVLAGALARYIIEQGWQDQAFVDNAATADEIAQETDWRRARWATDFADYQAYVTSMDAYALENAAQITGVPVENIQRAAELMARPNDDGTPRKTLITFEKGAIWSVNYETVGSLANLAILTGSTGGEGRGITRAGGHQEGYAGGAPYPLDAATDTFEGNKIPNYIDQHIADGEVRLYHAIGVNPLGMTNSAQWARGIIMAKQAVIPGPQHADTQAVIDNLTARMDEGGLVLVSQDIFPNLTTRTADIVLPAATWGEMPGCRWNGERRLRLSDRFMDPPGEARPDWWVIAEVAKKLGFSGYDWADENEIFEEAAGSLPTDAGELEMLAEELRTTEPAGHESHLAVVVSARLQDKTAHDVMRDLGTNGVQLPARLDANNLVIGTPRIHSTGQFDSASGKPMFLRVGWDTAEAIWDSLKPDTAAGEFWLSNGRIEEIWQTMYTDLRKPEVMARWPSNIVEINPEDATALSVQNGDSVSLSSDRVARKETGQFDSGSFTAVAYVSDIVPPGVLWTNFAYPDQWANNVAPRLMHPVNPVTPFKLARAKLTRLGSTDLADRVTFAPRNIPPVTN